MRDMNSVSCVALAFSLCAASGAMAQTVAEADAAMTAVEQPDAAPDVANSQQSSAAESAEGSQGDIVVTAQRRSERLIDVPISITAASSEKLAAAGVDSVRGLSQVTPGLLLLDAGQRLQPSIRGITSQGTNAGEESNVSLYIDDAYIPSQSAALFQLADVDRVEVLKGPQGTLFGRNSTGGAIRIQTRDPGVDPTIELKAKYGFKQNDKELSIYAATPLDENVAASFAGLITDRDGFVRNLNPASDVSKLGASESVSGRVKVVVEPAPNLNFVLSADYVNLKEQSPGTIPIIGGRSVYRSRPGVIIPQGDYETAYSQIPLLHYRGWGTTLTGRLESGSYTFKSISAYRRSAVPTARNDVDRTNLSLQSNDATRFFTTSFTQDLNVSFDDGGQLTWIGGLFYIDSKGSVGLINYGGDISPTTVLSGRVGVVDTSAVAGYGEATFQLSDTLSITGGARYSYEHKDYIYESILTANPITFSAEDAWSNVSYRGVVKFAPSPSANIYASYSTGFKAGTFNTSTPTSNPVDPETVNAAEIGIKLRPWNGGFLTFAAFDYRYKDIQTIALIQDAQGTRNALANAASAKVQGLEIGLDTRVGPIELTSGISWLPVARYVSFPGAIVYLPAANGGNTLVNGTDISGTRMVRAPKFTGNLGLTYRMPVANGELMLSGNYAYNGGFLFVQGETSPNARQGAYGLLNASAAWTSPDDRYTFELYGENLTKQVYRTYIIQTANGDSGSFGRPIEVGLRVRAKF